MLVMVMLVVVVMLVMMVMGDCCTGDVCGVYDDGCDGSGEISAGGDACVEMVLLNADLY